MKFYLIKFIVLVRTYLPCWVFVLNGVTARPALNNMPSEYKSDGQ